MSDVYTIDVKGEDNLDIQICFTKNLKDILLPIINVHLEKLKKYLESRNTLLNGDKVLLLHYLPLIVVDLEEERDSINSYPLIVSKKGMYIEIEIEKTKLVREKKLEQLNNMITFFKNFIIFLLHDTDILSIQKQKIDMKKILESFHLSLQKKLQKNYNKRYFYSGVPYNPNIISPTRLDPTQTIQEQRVQRQTIQEQGVQGAPTRGGRRHRRRRKTRRRKMT